MSGNRFRSRWPLRAVAVGVTILGLTVGAVPARANTLTPSTYEEVLQMSGHLDSARAVHLAHAQDAERLAMSGVATTTLPTLGDDPSYLSNAKSVFDGVTAIAGAVAACEEPNNPFPACIFSGSKATLAALQKIQQTLDELVQQQRQDFTELSAQLDKIQTSIDQGSVKASLAALLGDFNTVDQATTTYQALTDCTQASANYATEKLTNPATQVPQCKVYTAEGSPMNDQPASPATLATLQANFLASQGISSTNFNGSYKSEPRVFIEQVGGSASLKGDATNPYLSQGLLDEVGLLGRYFTLRLDQEKQALANPSSLAQPKALAVVRSSFINDMGATTYQVLAILNNYYVVRKAAAQLVGDTGTVTDLNNFYANGGTTGTFRPLSMANIAAKYTAPGYDPQTAWPSASALMAGDTAGPLVVDGAALPVASADNSATKNGATLLSSQQAMNLGNDLYAAGQAWSALQGATPIINSDGSSSGASVFYEAQGGNGANPGTATGRLWAAQENLKYVQTTGGSACTSPCGGDTNEPYEYFYYWNPRANVPGFNNNEDSGWQQIGFYTQPDSPLNGSIVSHSKMINILDSPFGSAWTGGSSNVCTGTVAACQWNSQTVQPTAALPYFDPWLTHQCNDYEPEAVDGCSMRVDGDSRVGVGVGSSFYTDQNQPPQSAPYAQNLKFKTWNTGGILQLPKNQPSS